MFCVNTYFPFIIYDEGKGNNTYLKNKFASLGEAEYFQGSLWVRYYENRIIHTSKTDRPRIYRKIKKIKNKMKDFELRFPQFFI